jgi:hypothetical protein
MSCLIVVCDGNLLSHVWTIHIVNFLRYQCVVILVLSNLSPLPECCNDAMSCLWLGRFNSIVKNVCSRLWLSVVLHLLRYAPSLLTGQWPYSDGARWHKLWTRHGGHEQMVESANFHFNYIMTINFLCLETYTKWNIAMV